MKTVQMEGLAIQGLKSETRQGEARGGKEPAPRKASGHTTEPGYG